MVRLINMEKHVISAGSETEAAWSPMDLCLTDVLLVP